MYRHVNSRLRLQKREDLSRNTTINFLFITLYRALDSRNRLYTELTRVNYALF